LKRAAFWLDSLPGSGAFSHRTTIGTKAASELLPGTLDLLILKTLLAGRQHGYGIARRLKDVSEDVLQVGESSLYPALQRLLLQGWVKAEWGASENNRRARCYTLTPAGRKQLAVERQEFDRLILAIHKVLNTA
jgi:PadR family transcriptional regulator, regulatory protein PadR